MRILVTSSRMPFALAMVRKLAAAGHDVYASDDTDLAPGSHSKYGFADHLKRLPETVGDLARVHDAGDGWHDPLPTLYSALAVAHDSGHSLRDHEKLFVSMAGDISWDGEPIAGMSAADSALLEELTGDRR